MAIQIINVGSAPNSDDADSIRQAYQRCNENFSGYFYREQIYPITGNFNVPTNQGTTLVSGDALRIVLPDSSGVSGRLYSVKLIVAGTATVSGSGNQTIDTTTTYTLSGQYNSVTVQSDKYRWWVISSN